MKMIYILSILLIKFKIEIYIHWISTYFNILADQLSRFEIVNFKNWCSILNLHIDSSSSKSDNSVDSFLSSLIEKL